MSRTAEIRRTTKETDIALALNVDGSGKVSVSTGLGFLDSTGLSALLIVHREVSRSGVVLHLDNRPPHLERVLEITGLLDHFTTVPVAASQRPDEIEIG